MTVSLTSVPGKVTEQIVLETNCKHVKDKMLISTDETRVECQYWTGHSTTKACTYQTKSTEGPWRLFRV